MKEVIGNATLYLGDCLDILPTLDKVDAVVTDPPYGITSCPWDSEIPLGAMWEALKAISKHDTPFIFTAAQPFTSSLIMSKLGHFKYCWYWNKVLPRGHMNAKIQPLRVVEEVVVFYAAQPTYNPQKTANHLRKTARTVYQKEGDGLQVYGKEKRDTFYDSAERFPTGLIEISTANQADKVHPTQKPVALMEYLILTYSNEKGEILDFTMGSGTTGVACMNLNRNFVGIEKDPKYFDMACERIENAQRQKSLF